MKKMFASVLLSVVTIVPTFAQDKPKAGDVIYGKIVDINGPVVGAKVTERNGCDRIMAQTTTDINGEFVFRAVNPDNRLIITNMDYETIDLPLNKTSFDLNMKKQAPLSPVRIIDGPASLLLLIPEITTDIQEITDDDFIKLGISTPFYHDMLQSPIRGLMKNDVTIPTNELPGNGIYIPFTDYTRYYTIDELFDNWYPRF